MDTYSKKLRHGRFAENAEIVISVKRLDSCFTVVRSGGSIIGSWGTSKPGLPPLESITFATEDDATKYAKGVVKAHMSRFGFRSSAYEPVL